MRNEIYGWKTRERQYQRMDWSISITRRTWTDWAWFFFISYLNVRNDKEQRKREKTFYKSLGENSKSSLRNHYEEPRIPASWKIYLLEISTSEAKWGAVAIESISMLIEKYVLI